MSHAPSKLNKWTGWTLVDGVDEYLDASGLVAPLCPLCPFRPLAPRVPTGSKPEIAVCGTAQ